MHKADVLVIGAGAVGTAVARELSKYKLRTLVTDKLNDVGGQASKSNSAIVHTGFDAPPGSLESDLVVHANPMFDQLCEELDIPLKRTGAILTALTEIEEQELPAILAKAAANHVYDVELLNADDIRRLEPRVSPEVLGGIYVPRESITDPFMLVVAQAENAARNGVEFIISNEISGISSTDDGFVAESSNGEITVQYVINAAGLYSDSVSGFLGIEDFTMHPRRGQFHILDRAANLGIEHIILPVPTKVTKGKLLAPSVHGNWLIGPTAEELIDKTADETTAQGLEEVIAGVSKLVPSVSPDMAITQYAGLRPVRDPGGYHLRDFEALPGYIELSGIRSTGVSSSLAVARYAVNLLMKQGMNAGKRGGFVRSRMSIPKYSDLDNSAREKLIEKDPTYGRVICRCETVTEGEIREAIRRGPG
ncbi:MAG: NAD(P)/FAD-dependent oxidoreductase, partial [Spirochaetales bacterium]|nr:NAD(P)/FAD-dependent oxidoreductase [Spirochaetales bacterium]